MSIRTSIVWPRSLQRRLPLLMATLVVTVVLIIGAIAANEVRVAARENAREAIDAISQAVSVQVGGNLQRRANVLLTMLRDTATGAPVALDSALFRRFSAVRGDGNYRARDIRNERGMTLFSTARDSIVPEDEAAIQSLIARIDSDSIHAGAFYRVGNEVRFWTVVPVRSSDRVLGYLAENTLLPRTTAAEENIRRLTREAIEIFYTVPSGDIWVSPDGTILDAPFELEQVGSDFETTVNGQAIVGVSQRLPNTDWVVVYTVPTSTSIARAMSLLRNLGPYGAIILVLSVVAAWFISRSVAQPLNAMVDAANGIARGDYSKRVPEPFETELQQLAQAFNSMAERVGTSYAELEQRNTELRAAQDEAIAARNLSEKMRNQAVMANEAKTAFLAMMSHELRTPLSAIGGYTEILQLGLRGPLTDQQKADLERIYANQRHLLTIINDMLDLSQIESGNLSVTMDEVSLDDVFVQVEPIVAPLVAQKRLSYDVDPAVRTLKVFADRERLRQVMVNLISNAARFSDVGGSISVHATMRKGRVSVHVTDTGIGIPQEKLESIFQPFVQVETGPRRRAGGTGLGLPISRRLAEAMEGSLHVTSELGVGSTFTLDLRAVAELETKPDLRVISGGKRQIA